MSTAFNPARPAPGVRVKNQKTAWDEALDSLDKRRPIKLDKNFDNEGKPSVTLLREFDAQRAEALWRKEYKSNKDFDLKVFNKHEVNMLNFLRNTKYSYHFVSSRDYSDTSFARKTGKDSASESFLVATDKGVTLKQWQTWRVKMGTVEYTDTFRLAGHYLRFALGALRALDELHSTGMVHCDLNTGNWCIPTEHTLFKNSEHRLRLEPDWSHVSIIDVGYSVHPSTPLKTLLPIDHTASRYLKDACIKAEQAGKRAFDAIPAHKKTANQWESFSDVIYEELFWSTHAPLALTAFVRLDWREDYWKLGHVLKVMRDTDRVPCSRVSAVNKLIGSNEAGYGGLAEELIAWGRTDTPYDPIDDDAEFLVQTKNLREETYAALKQKLEATIALLTPEDDARHVFIARRDLDDEYRKKLEKKEEWSQEWDGFVSKAIRASVLTAGVAGTVGLGVAAWPVAQKEFEEIQAADKRKKQNALAAANAAQEAKEKALAAEQAAQEIAKKDQAATAQKEQALIANYTKQTDLIQASDWWRKGRSNRIKPSEEQTGWVQNTLDYATQKKWPSAQFVLGQLYCSGAHPQLAAQSMQACGQWVGAALGNTDFNTALDASQRSALANAAVAQFDYVVYGPKAANGLAQGSLPGYSDFAQGILPGLLARQSDFPALAIRAAHVQACNLQPPQRTAAEQTLTTLVKQNQGSEVATYAQGWLNQWRNGDYSRCNTDIHANPA